MPTLDFMCLWCKSTFTKYYKWHKIPNRPTCSQKCYYHYVRSNEAIINRFWKYVDIVKGKDQCWEWVGSADNGGYGNFSYLVDDVLVHEHATRFSFRLKFGDLPEDRLVCHTCDNPPCVRPKHLFLGDFNSNMQDSVIKDRSARGERSGMAKINTEEVLWIRKLYSEGLSTRDIAAIVNISKSQVHVIVSRQQWRHV